MQQLISFIRKELYHIWRDKKTMFILLGMPIVQIIIFGFALTNEVKNVKFAVLDYAKDNASQRLITALDASEYFDVTAVLQQPKAIEQAFKNGSIKMALVIPQAFEQELLHTNKAQIQCITDASDPNVANTIINYTNAIVGSYQQELQQQPLPYTIEVTNRMLYNPQLKGAYNFVPGVMAMVLLLVSTMMTAITIVKEKEIGTMEIMLVSPLQPLKIVIGKAIPYLALSIINIISILLLSVFVLEVPINGSLALLVGESILFILVSLALGLLISASAASQQAAMFVSLVGMFLPTIMLSGFMFPIENMPKPLQIVSNIVPAKWYFIIVKNVMIKGVGIEAVWKETIILTGMFLFFLSMAIRKFKIRLA